MKKCSEIQHEIEIINLRLLPCAVIRSVPDYSRANDVTFRHEGHGGHVITNAVRLRNDGGETWTFGSWAWAVILLLARKYGWSGGVQYTDAPDSSAQSNTLPNDELVSLGAAICRALDDIPEDDDLSVSIVKAVFPVVEVNGHTSISAFSGLEGRELAWKFVKFLESGGCRA